jgi:hypothetical protein
LQPIRVYADTSVFGGLFDTEFKKQSEPFFDKVHTGEFKLVVSSVVADELRDAPSHVQQFFDSLLPLVELLEVTKESEKLCRSYIASGIVTQKWEADALHVATATVSNCQIFVSWNFKHIVNYRRISLYNRVNVEHGFASIAIHTPPEVVADED